MAPPDDALLRAVLVKLFADRQLAVDESLVGYVAPRIERSFAAARAVVARLDEEAMRQQAAVNQGVRRRNSARDRSLTALGVRTPYVTQAVTDDGDIAPLIRKHFGHG